MNGVATRDKATKPDDPASLPLNLLVRLSGELFKVLGCFAKSKRDFVRYFVLARPGRHRYVRW